MVKFFCVPGKTAKIEHKIKLVEKEPVGSKSYRFSYALRQELKNEIAEMLDMWMLWNSALPYASPMVAVKKKNGSNNIFVDYEKLNKLTISNPEPIQTSCGRRTCMQTSLVNPDGNTNCSEWSLA